MMNTTADDILRPAKISKEEISESLFFLPKEVLDNVLKYISGIPNAKKWEMHLDLRNLVEIFAVRGGFGRCAQSLFNTLRVTTRKDDTPESNKYGWHERDGRHLWTNSMDVAHQYILAGGGESLETLVLGNPLSQMKRDGEGIINDFVEHCPNVTSLSIVENGSSWVNAFGNQLEKLELRTEFPIDFPVISTKLRELTLNKLSGSYISTELWRRIGSNLEKLKVHDFWLSEDEIEDIKQHCRNLKNVSLEGKDYKATAALATLLASYGEQLEYALLHKMDEVYLKEVVDACPKARFCLKTWGTDRLFTGLNILGPSLEFISNFGWEFTENIDGWKNAWGKATTLGKLDILILKAGYAEAIFSAPKEHLKELAIWLPRNAGENDVKKVMDICAKGTKCVETFSYRGRYFNRDTAKNFFEQNKDSLSSIAIRPTVRARDKKLNKLLDSFLELPVLENVCLDYRIPKNTLKALEKRGVYWKRY